MLARAVEAKREGIRPRLWRLSRSADGGVHPIIRDEAAGLRAGVWRCCG